VQQHNDFVEWGNLGAYHRAQGNYPPVFRGGVYSPVSLRLTAAQIVSVLLRIRPEVGFSSSGLAGMGKRDSGVEGRLSDRIRLKSWVGLLRWEVHAAQEVPEARVGAQGSFQLGSRVCALADEAKLG
jgi:hypothetical protein